ncbi:MAG: hypothetical protein EA350_08515 [Gemmatimonadales bacterium]|nr:MAG: hypothetical protein EA350_08515 [Gemmatimonadales bacterium]
MSDFLFTSRASSPEALSAAFGTIWLDGAPEILGFGGEWGRVGATRSPYRGFDPLETQTHVCAIAGGPILNFRDNDFLSGTDPHAATRALVDRWIKGHMDWGEDLSGPFAVLIVEKATGEATCVTDLMMFLPVYRFTDDANVVFGTHVDAVACAAGQSGRFDEVSLLDFVLHFALTYPYTAYREIRQCRPATVHRLPFPVVRGRSARWDEHPYWRPTETMPHQRLRDAAHSLRDSVRTDIERVVASMDRVGQFLSGGEDSRAVAGMLPDRLHRDAFIFLDQMNREGRVAAQAAEAYGATFVPGFRTPLHYLEILPAASALVGTGHQYIHAHALGFHGSLGLDAYPAVFGGYLADSLFKGMYAPKHPLNHRHHFLPEIGLSHEPDGAPVRHPLFPADLLEQVTTRRRSHLATVREFRPTSAREWSGLWPMTGRAGIPNIYANRRLFASYEPFTGNRAVKLAAEIPTAWKLNRRLFRGAFHPYLAPTRWLPHADGRLPWFPWWINVPVQFRHLLQRRISGALGRRTPHEGPWNDWNPIVRSSRWAEAIEGAASAAEHLPHLGPTLGRGVLTDSSLGLYQKINLLQACVQVKRGAASMP